jgi:hypothetical protein
MIHLNFNHFNFMWIIIHQFSRRRASGRKSRRRPMSRSRRGPRWRSRKKRPFSCVCGARFDTKGKRNSHQRDGCKELRARKVELHAGGLVADDDAARLRVLRALYSVVDDMMYRDKCMVARMYDGTVLCSDCSEADPYYEHEQSCCCTRVRSRTICRYDARWPRSSG